jgi:tRNA-2-methylthio-N6-dimethylallyladenosine synthase
MVPLDTGVFTRPDYVFLPDTSEKSALKSGLLPERDGICDNNFMSAQTRKKYFLRTFGCQMNFHDSEKIAGLLSRGGLEEAGDKGEADVIIFNTCSIREKAEQKFLSELGRLKALKRKRPHLKIIIAGCIAQQMGENLFRKAPFIDYILGPQNIGAIEKLMDIESNKGRGVFLEENPALPDVELPARRKDKPKAWVSIMFGCNNFCSYCIVPYTRGREVSRPSQKIIEEISGLAREGFKEVTLLGQNVNSYKSDSDFPGLLKKIHEAEGIHRIRFVTSHPRDLSEELIKVMAGYSKICEHIHLPLQSGSDAVLGKMNRGYTYSSYKEKVDLIRRYIPHISITTDIIAGFPGETDGDHKATIRALNEIEYDGIFAFRYSPRPGTPAEKYPGQVPFEVKTERLTEILALQDQNTSKKNKPLEGSTQEVLVEGLNGANGADELTGRTRTNKVVNFPGPASLKGELVNVKILEAKRHTLRGEILLDR